MLLVLLLAPAPFHKPRPAPTAASLAGCWEVAWGPVCRLTLDLQRGGAYREYCDGRLTYAGTWRVEGRTLHVEARFVMHDGTACETVLPWSLPLDADWSGTDSHWKAETKFLRRVEAPKGREGKHDR